MIHRRRLSAKLAALPPEARRLALTHLAHLASKQRKAPDHRPTCPSCRDRVTALVRAIKRDLPFPPETCPRCEADWITVCGKVPPGPYGQPILPARRSFLRFGMAILLDCPLRLLPEDTDLVRAFSIAHLVTSQDISGPFVLKAVRLPLEGAEPHQRRPWDERIKTLNRRLEAQRRDPKIERSSTLNWYRGDLFDYMNSEVLIAPDEIDFLGDERPELLSYAKTRSTLERLEDLPDWVFAAK